MLTIIPTIKLESTKAFFLKTIDWNIIEPNGARNAKPIFLKTPE